MKKPSLKEVKEYFKGAKVILDLHNDKADITKRIKRDIHDYHSVGYWIDLEDNQYNLWNDHKGYAKIIEYKEGYINNPNKTIDKVTIDRLSMVLRLNNIQLCDSILDTVIDAVELIEEKGGQVTLEDIVNLKSNSYERIPRMVSKQMPGDTRY